MQPSRARRMARNKCTRGDDRVELLPRLTHREISSHTPGVKSKDLGPVFQWQQQSRHRVGSRPRSRSPSSSCAPPPTERQAGNLLRRVCNGVVVVAAGVRTHTYGHSTCVRIHVYVQWCAAIVPSSSYTAEEISQNRYNVNRRTFFSSPPVYLIFL